jgi:hypothetical protein
MVADGQGNLVTRDTLHQWQSVSDQNVSSMAHVAARDFGFLTLTRPSTARIYNQTRVSCSRCHPGRACRRQRTFALRRPRCGQRTECRGRRSTHFNAVLRSISGLRRISSPENKKIEGRATALSSVRTAPTTAPSWNLLFARGVQR